MKLLFNRVHPETLKSENGLVLNIDMDNNALDFDMALSIG